MRKVVDLLHRFLFTETSFNGSVQAKERLAQDAAQSSVICLVPAAQGQQPCKLARQYFLFPN